MNHCVRQNVTKRLKARQMCQQFQKPPLLINCTGHSIMHRTPNRKKAFLFTLDVSSLYSNIPHNEVIDACRQFLNTRDRNASSSSTETLCDFIRMIFTMNNFSFNANITYRHIVPVWRQGWLLRTPAFFSSNSRRTPYHVPLSSPSYGGVS